MFCSYALKVVVVGLQ